VVAAVIVVADQLTNAYVLAHVTLGPHHLFGPLGIDVGRNRGVAFSLISRHSTLAVVLTMVLTVVVAVCTLRVATKTAGVVFGLLLGGGLGNDVDRVARRSSGGVVDFLTLPHWPAFNLADVAITFGVIGLVVLVALRKPILLPWRST
jgi:signal peptidase II